MVEEKSLVSLCSKCQFCGNIYYLSFERPSEGTMQCCIFSQRKEEKRGICAYSISLKSLYISKDTLHYEWALFFHHDKYMMRNYVERLSLHDWYFLASNTCRCLREFYLNSYWRVEERERVTFSYSEGEGYFYLIAVHCTLKMQWLSI